MVASSEAVSLPADQKAKLYDSFGSAGLAIALSPSAQPFHALKVANQDALVAYKVSTTITDSPTVYANVVKLLDQKGEAVRAAQAKVMADVASESPDIKKSMDVNVHKLKKDIFKDLPSDMGQQVAIEPTETQTDKMRGDGAVNSLPTPPIT
jgi:hypothetical protein